PSRRRSYHDCVADRTRPVRAPPRERMGKRAGGRPPGIPTFPHAAQLCARAILDAMILHCSSPARRNPRPLLRTTATTIALLAALLIADPARAQSGVQLTPDGARTLVSKDVAGQRWAITRH